MCVSQTSYLNVETLPNPPDSMFVLLTAASFMIMVSPALCPHIKDGSQGYTTHTELANPTYANTLSVCNANC